MLHRSASLAVPSGAAAVATVERGSTDAAMDGMQDYKRRTYEVLGPAPGQRILDVGCGTGDDARTLAALVGTQGLVVGIDCDAALVAEARRRSHGLALPLDYRSGDALALEFADATFDACRADCTLQHLRDPRRALDEMARVVRPGARVVVSDPDWETLVVDAPDRALTRRILGFWCDRIVRNGWMGRQLAALCRGAGLRDVEVVPVALVWTDLATALEAVPIPQVAEAAGAQGIVSHEEAAAWLAGVHEADRAGRFLGSVTGFIAAGRRP